MRENPYTDIILFSQDLTTPQTDAQEPFKLRDHAYPAAAGLGHTAARSSYTDPLSPDGYTSQRAGGANSLSGQCLEQARD